MHWGHSGHSHSHHAQQPRDAPTNYPYGGYAPPLGPPPVPSRHPSPYPPTGYAAPPGPPPVPSRHPSPYPPQYAAPPGPPPRPPIGQQSYHFPSAGQAGTFHYSQCNGKKKALLVGINYIGQPEELHGCIEDVHRIKRLLLGRGYREEDMVVLTDDAQNYRQRPTRQNMLDAMHWLVRDAQPNDSLFFHYSGHGGRAQDLNGYRKDGLDDVIYPVDFKTTSHIIDDEMHTIMARVLPAGCRLTAIFDACHSGSALVLPYTYSTEGKLKEPNAAKDTAKGLFSAFVAYERHDLQGIMSGVTDLANVASGRAEKAFQYSKATRTCVADVISWSGCKDDETSADAQIAGHSTGAMTNAFLTALSRDPYPSYRQLLVDMRNILRDHYSQKPQFSSAHPIDTNLQFII